MTIQQLIEELKKLPPAAAHQDIKTERNGYLLDVVGVRWEGNSTVLEAE